jgi:hypothetical protein
MPCLEIKDLSPLAEQHITSQKATITNLRSRKTELEAEEKRLSTLADADTNPKLKQVREAVNHLRLELDGEIESPPGSRNFVKDPVKKTAEERVEVMAALYRERTQFVFNDTTKVEGKERKASVFGLPTVEEMQRLQHKDVADAMMVRATSLLLQRQDGRNPVDFLDTFGLNVKVPLANVVEHHHIYNNVHLNEKGRVEFKSFKIRQDRNTGELKMDIVPTYWNSEKHGRNTQFIGLLDGMHSGQDPVTHMHYYRFTDDEAKLIKEKIRTDIKGITDEAKTRQQKLEGQLSTLKARAADPKGYENKLTSQIASTNTQLQKAKADAKGLLSKPKASLTPDQLALREAHDAKQKELKKLTKDLEEHRTLSSIRGDIDAGNSRIADLSAKANAIKLTDYPKGPERDAKKLEREAIIDQISTLKNENRDREKLLKEKGDIEGQIKDAERKVGEAKAIASLSEKDALDMFDRSNGWLSFDKGAAEKEDHEQYRPLMNQELTRHYVRETLKYMEREYGDNALEALQSTARQQYKQNILDRLGALQDKVKM